MTCSLPQHDDLGCGAGGRVPGIRNRSVRRRFLRVFGIGFACALLSSCTGTQPPGPLHSSAKPRPTVVPSEPRQDPSSDGSDWARTALGQGADPEALAATFRRVPGGELDLLARMLNAAMHESRDVGAALRVAAGLAGQAELDRAGCRVVGEVAGRVCCLRGSFAARALDGLADAVRAGSVPVCLDAETAGRLEVMRASPDRDLAASAGTLLELLLGLPHGTGS